MAKRAPNPTIVPDWGVLGKYENVAEALLPVSQAVIEAAELVGGERVLDIGARTGNAALLAARAGARVTAIDFSPRLLGVARERVSAESDQARFELAEVTSLPFESGSFDVILDVISLMFVEDREAAVAEMARVLAPGGRIVWTGWLPEGAVVEAVRIHAEAAGKVLGHAPYSYTKWYDESDMSSLFGSQGLEVSLTTREMSYAAPSPRAWKEAMDASHPLAIACTKVIKDGGRAEEVDSAIMKVLEEGNEDPQAFKVSFRYIVGIAKRKH